MNSQRTVHGQLVIPFSISISENSNDDAIQYAASLLNSFNIKFIEIKIHTKDEKEHILNATHCKVDWFDSTSENEI